MEVKLVLVVVCKTNIKEVGCSLGTTIEVNDIFYNVPARQKFLKSPQREAALISDIVTRLALANSKISFRLTNNGKKILNTYSTENLFDTIRTIYGKTIAENIIKFEKHNDISSVYGYVGNSEISRGSRNNQSIFINKRYIKNKLIGTAVENAVKSFLMINKYPFFVLFLDIFPEFVDVNVHPTKAEVKFQNDREIFKLVFDAVHEAIRDSLRGTFEFDIEDSLDSIRNTKTEVKEIVQIPIDLKDEHSKVKNENYSENTLFQNKTDNDNVSGILRESGGNAITRDSYAKAITNENNYEKMLYSHNSNSELKPKFPALKVIGQFHNTYILAEAFEELYLIDQHAAHEKILFEKYTKEIREGQVVAQILLTPEVIELSSEDYLYYVENKELFKNSGFNMEEFGENTVSIREVPNFLGKPQLKEYFISIIDNLKKLGSGETYEVKYNKIASLSCKAAIKANDSLSVEEMKTLIETLRNIEDPYNCPHGRPTIIKITLYELEKKFKRIQ